jgi:CheY-like chemotaxis protein
MEFRGQGLKEDARGVRGGTVLIAEDEWLIRMELAAAFEDRGYVVRESASGEDALAYLRAHPSCDLLITDIRLSGALSGWDLAIAARALHPGLAVIYVSANPPAPGQVVDGGVFLDKPALITQVTAAACRLLGT